MGKAVHFSWGSAQALCECSNPPTARHSGVGQRRLITAKLVIQSTCSCEAHKSDVSVLRTLFSLDSGLRQNDAITSTLDAPPNRAYP